MWLPTILNKLSNSNGTNVNICLIMKVDDSIEVNLLDLVSIIHNMNIELKNNVILYLIVEGMR